MPQIGDTGQMQLVWERSLYEIILQNEHYDTTWERLYHIKDNMMVP